MEDTEKIIIARTIQLEQRIVGAGKYINAITEDCFNGIKMVDGKEVDQSPTEQAAEILEVAKEIQEMAIQYELLTGLDEQIERRKKAVDSDQDPTQDTIND